MKFNWRGFILLLLAAIALYVINMTLGVPMWLHFLLCFLLGAVFAEIEPPYIPKD